MRPNVTIEVVEYVQDGYVVSTAPDRLDLDMIHGYLSRSYWSPGIPRDVVARSMVNSLCFGVYDSAAQVGFARVISDYTTFAYLADVFILEPHQGRGLGKWLVACVLKHPKLQGLRRWMLATQDAQGLYAQYGFSVVDPPERFMQIRNSVPSYDQP